MKLLAALVLPAFLALGFAYAGVRLVGGAIPSSQPRATGVVWGDRTFANRAELGRWLRARGLSYRAWERRHPRSPTRAEPKAAPRRANRSDLLVGGSLVAFVAFALVLRRRVSLDRRRVLLGAVQVVGASGRARSAALVTARRHPDLGWYLAGCALIAGAAFVVAGWT